MTRDPKRLHVFDQAHALTLEVYKLTAGLPPAEQFGLQAQLRRASVSINANLSEGSGRGSGREYAKFVDIATGSAMEVRYLLDLIRDLDWLPAGAVDDCRKRSDTVTRMLLKLQRAVAHFEP
jgi:four helix bundle protein